MSLLLDISQVLKLMGRNLKFTISTSLVMATGLTVALFLFSFVYSTMYAELPYKGGERIRVLDVIENGVAYSGNSVPHHIYNDYKSWPHSLEGASAFKTTKVTLTLPNQTRKYVGAYSEPAMFTLTQTSPLQGELFTEKHLGINSENVIMISEMVALEMFGNTQSVVGKLVQISGESHKVTAVLPQSFKFPQATDVWLPLKNTVTSFNRGEEANVSIFGKLPKGLSEENFNSELNSFMTELRNKHPKLYQNTYIQARRFQEAFLGSAGDIMAISIELSAGLLLLLACANASNMLFTRAVQRKRESAIRMAIGANPGRLFVQMMLESSIICTLSALLALVITYFALNVLDQTIINAVSFKVPFWWDFKLTPTLILITSIVTLTTIVVTGLLPAWKMATTNHFNTNQNHHKMKSGKLSKILVILEIFLSSCLLLLTAAFVYSVDKQNEESFGIDPQGYLTASISLESHAFNTPQKIANYYKELGYLIEQSEHTAITAFSTGLPAHNVTKKNIFMLGDQTEQQKVNAVRISNKFFSTLNIKLHSGRTFQQNDKLNTPLVAVVTQALAQRYWPNENAIGKRIRFEENSTQWYQIIGVVNNVAYGETFAQQGKYDVVFTAINQHPSSTFKIIINTPSNPYDFVSQLRAVSAKLPSSTAPYRINSLVDAIDQNRASILYITKMFVALSIVALILALSGIYSVVSSNVLSKSNEIGIRMALGADFIAIIKLVSFGVIIQLIIGLLLGMALSSYTLIILERLNIVSTTPFIYWLVPTLMLCVVIFATTIPLRRVLKDPPSNALRYE